MWHTGNVTQSGRCLCGSITYEVDGPLRDVVNCHCSRCRSHTGHYMAATRATADDLQITGDSLSWYNPTDEVKYGFCQECGSTLFWRTKRTPGYISIAAGTLTPPTGLKTVAAIYTDYASDYHSLDPDIASYSEDR